MYTYNGLYYGIKGTRVRFATRSGSNTPHRLSVFNVEDKTISWSSTSNSEHRTDMWVDIPADGYYKIIVRTNTMGTTGVCDVLMYNKYILKDMPISMTRYIVGQEANKTLNTFTAHSSVKSSIWCEAGLSGKVLAYNDGYNGNGDYEWGNNARIKKSYDILVKNVYIAAANSSSPLGKCDLYIGCGVDNTILGSSFPSLKSDDMIRSAGINSEYNCIGWTGGLISWAWPMTEMLEDIKDPKAQLSWFDNFYGKERYPGSPVYTRNGANENNSVIDLWGYVEGSIVSGFIIKDTTAYTHASIRKCLDGIPHGYDWESKCGSLPRIFHPRYSLKGKDYGRVVHYYRPVNNIQKSATIDEVIADGMAVMENVKLTSGELAIIEDGISKIDGDIILEFGNLFSEWKSLWESNVASNPFILKKHEKYTKLLDFCKDHDSESLRCLVFKMLSDSGMCAMNLVIDLYLSGNRSLMNEVVSYNALNKYDENGAFIIRSPLSQTKMFVKKILGVSSKSSVNVCNETMNYSVDVESVSSQLLVNVSIEVPSLITIVISDKDGNITNVLNNVKLESGKYSFPINVSNHGIYYVRTIIDGEWVVKKIII